MLTHTGVTQTRLDRLTTRERRLEAELAEIRALKPPLRAELALWQAYERRMSEWLSGLRAHPGAEPAKVQP